MTSVESAVCYSMGNLYSVIVCVCVCVCVYQKDISQNVSSAYLWVLRLWVIIFPLSPASLPHLPAGEGYPVYLQSPSLEYITLRMRSKKREKETVMYFWKKMTSHFVNFLGIPDSQARESSCFALPVR